MYINSDTMKKRGVDDIIPNFKKICRNILEPTQMANTAIGFTSWQYGYVRWNCKMAGNWATISFLKKDPKWRIDELPVSCNAFSATRRLVKEASTENLRSDEELPVAVSHRTAHGQKTVQAMCLALSEWLAN